MYEWRCSPFKLINLYLYRLGSALFHPEETSPNAEATSPNECVFLEIPPPSQLDRFGHRRTPIFLRILTWTSGSHGRLSNGVLSPTHEAVHIQEGPTQPEILRVLRLPDELHPGLLHGVSVLRHKRDWRTGKPVHGKDDACAPHFAPHTLRCSAVARRSNVELSVRTRACSQSP
jgi:hypothetical protein